MENKYNCIEKEKNIKPKTRVKSLAIGNDSDLLRLQQIAKFCIRREKQLYI